MTYLLDANTIQLGTGETLRIADHTKGYYGPPYPTDAELERDGVSRYIVINNEGEISFSKPLTQEMYEIQCKFIAGSVEAAEAQLKHLMATTTPMGVSTRLYQCSGSD